jgi:cysteinyl-tRNA synthetase
MIKSEIPDVDKLTTAYHFDEILGLGLAEHRELEIKIPEHVQALLFQREKARFEKDWQKSDQIRNEVEKFGFIISDKNGEQKIVKK